jgi:hypothetical protein
VEAGVSISHLDYNDLYQPGIQQVPFTQPWYAGTSDYDFSRNARYVSGFLQQYFQTTRNTLSANAGYITGSHQFKFGITDGFGPNRYAANMNGDGWNEFSNGVPFAFLAFDTPFAQRAYLNADVGLYGMDTWHIKRLSLTYGLRYEYLSASIDKENAPAGRFVPARNYAAVNCSTVKGLGCWNNFAPRLGVVYDLFGNHKTAIKGGFGKYNTPYSTGFTANFNPMALATQTLFWNGGTSVCEPTCYALGSYAPTGTPNNTTSVPLGYLGSNPNPSFGIQPNINLDPNWHREYNYQYSVGLQQELHAGVTLNFNYYRRSDYQQTDLINYAVPPSAWTLFMAVNPLNGSPLPIFNLNPAYASGVAPVLYQTNLPQSLAKDVYNGFETSVVARLPHGAFLVGGWTIDRLRDRNCSETAGSAQTKVGNALNDPNTLRFCDMFNSSSLVGPGGINVQSLGAVPNTPFQNEFKLSGSYNIHWGIIGSASFYSNRYQGNFTPAGSNNVVSNDGYLGRTISVTSSTRYPADCPFCPNDPSTPSLKAKIDPNTPISETIQLVAPGQLLTPRLNQLDIGFKKTFRFREKYVLEPEAQIFNMLNSNAAISQSIAVSTTVAPFLSKSVCSANPGLTNCGVGGPVTTLTNPRILRLAMLFRF